jgi:predicted RNase H-like HicB family nuclease
MKFLVTVDRDEDGMWVAECPAIVGCVSPGAAKEEALESIREAIALCLGVRAERGLPLTGETRQIEVAMWMPPLPALSGREVVRIFMALGCARRRRGGHIMLAKDGRPERRGGTAAERVVAAPALSPRAPRRRRCPAPLGARYWAHILAG